MRTSLPASARLPLTIESAGRDSGTLSASLSSAAPVAVAAGERLAGPAADRRDVDEAQHVGERTTRRALDVEAGAAAELGDAALHAAPLDVADLRRAARMSSVERSTTISPDAEVNGGHDSRGVAAGRRRLGRHVGEGHALDLRGDAEVAVARHLRVVEREVPEIAADADGRARDRSFAHRAGDVVAHALRQAERQVARRVRGDTVDELAVELELARVAAAAADAAAGPERQVAVRSPLASALAKLADATLTLSLGAAPFSAASIFQLSFASSRSSGTSRCSNTPGRSSRPDWMSMRA
jgi:hypothetical protein